MSKLRSVNTHFWSDNYIISLDPVEKLLFLYLLTNDATNMLGIYELNIKRISFDTGIDKDMVSRIFDRFHQANKASYVEGYVALHNFTKHQSYNDNMKKSAINSFNELPKIVRSRRLCIPIAKGLKPFPKGFEPLIVKNPKNGDSEESERVTQGLPKGSEPIAEIEYEYEREVEKESESESEKSDGSYSSRLAKAESKKELFKLWFEYRKEKGRHPTLHEKDVLLNRDWADKSVKEIAESIAYTVQNGWMSLQTPDPNKTYNKEDEPLPQYLTTKLN